MQRVQYHEHGGPDTMRLETYHLPPPNKGEILLKVKAASINPLDWKLRQGFMKFMMGRRFPRSMGIDLAGIVEEVGPGVTGFAIGDEVVGQVPMMTPGAFAETAITTDKLVVKKPASLSFTAAAALPSVGVKLFALFLPNAVPMQQNLRGCPLISVRQTWLSERMAAFGTAHFARGRARMMKDFGCRPARRHPRALGRRPKSDHGGTRGPRATAYGFLRFWCHVRCGTMVLVAHRRTAMDCKESRRRRLVLDELATDIPISA